MEIRQSRRPGVLRNVSINACLWLELTWKIWKRSWAWLLVECPEFYNTCELADSRCLKYFYVQIISLSTRPKIIGDWDKMFHKTSKARILQTMMNERSLSVASLRYYKWCLNIRPITMKPVCSFFYTNSWRIRVANLRWIVFHVKINALLFYAQRAHMTRHHYTKSCLCNKKSDVRLLSKLFNTYLLKWSIEL